MDELYFSEDEIDQINMIKEMRDIVFSEEYDSYDEDANFASIFKNLRNIASQANELRRKERASKYLADRRAGVSKDMAQLNAHKKAIAHNVAKVMNPAASMIADHAKVKRNDNMKAEKAKWAAADVRKMKEAHLAKSKPSGPSGGFTAKWTKSGAEWSNGKLKATTTSLADAKKALAAKNRLKLDSRVAARAAVK